MNSSKQSKRPVSSGPSSRKGVTKGRSRPIRAMSRSQADVVRCALMTVMTIMGLLGVLELVYLYRLAQKVNPRRPSYRRRVPAASTFHQDNHTATIHHRSKKADDNDDKGPILEILKQAGVHIKKLDPDILAELPSWSQIQSLYGTGPKMYGLETCQRFRESTDAKGRFLAIAGTFNSGTNLLSALMIQNCQITERMEAFGEKSKGMRWQVPWGKHTPLEHREGHVTSTDKDVPFTSVLPMVTIRDPYQWMQSMCRHHYEAHWLHDSHHCPNLVPGIIDQQRFPEMSAHNDLVPVNATYPHVAIHHKSLAHMWNDWYQSYAKADFPRVMVRFEDLLFYGQQVEEALCECGGGVVRKDRKFPHFVHIQESAKLGTAAHGNHKTNLMNALIKYGNAEGRLDGMTEADQQAARDILDPDLMALFDYHH